MAPFVDPERVAQIKDNVLFSTGLIDDQLGRLLRLVDAQEFARPEVAHVEDGTGFLGQPVDALRRDVIGPQNVGQRLVALDRLFVNLIGRLVEPVGVEHRRRFFGWGEIDLVCVRKKQHQHHGHTKHKA